MDFSVAKDEQVMRSVALVWSAMRPGNLFLLEIFCSVVMGEWLMVRCMDEIACCLLSRENMSQEIIACQGFMRRM